jgi:hypothetical protein
MQFEPSKFNEKPWVLLVEDEQIIFGDIGTAAPTILSQPDALTKQTGRIKCYQHDDIIMGHLQLQPAYTRQPPRPNQPCISNKVSFSACD